MHSPHVCEEDIVYGTVNVLNSHCEWNGSVAGSIIKAHWVGRLNRVSDIKSMLNNTQQKAHWQMEQVLSVWRRAVLSVHTHAYFMPVLFILRIWQLSLVYWELEIQGSTTTTIWPSDAVQKEGSHTRRPTTGCFSINKDFLLSTEVPTDAFIGAKFTLCARRELPLRCAERRCSSHGAFSCLSCSWASQNKVRQPQQGSLCTPTSVSHRLYIWIWMTSWLLWYIEIIPVVCCQVGGVYSWLDALKNHSIRKCGQVFAIKAVSEVTFVQVLKGTWGPSWAGRADKLLY